MTSEIKGDRLSGSCCADGCTIEKYLWDVDRIPATIQNYYFKRETTQDVVYQRTTTSFGIRPISSEVDDGTPTGSPTVVETDTIDTDGTVGRWETVETLSEGEWQHVSTTDDNGYTIVVEERTDTEKTTEHERRLAMLFDTDDVTDAYIRHYHFLTNISRNYLADATDQRDITIRGVELNTAFPADRAAFDTRWTSLAFNSRTVQAGAATGVDRNVDIKTLMGSWNPGDDVMIFAYVTAPETSSVFDDMELAFSTQAGQFDTDAAFDDSCENWRDFFDKLDDPGEPNTYESLSTFPSFDYEFNYEIGQYWLADTSRSHQVELFNPVDDAVIFTLTYQWVSAGTSPYPQNPSTYQYYHYELQATGTPGTIAVATETRLGFIGYPPGPTLDPLFVRIRVREEGIIIGQASDIDTNIQSGDVVVDESGTNAHYVYYPYDMTAHNDKTLKLRSTWTGSGSPLLNVFRWNDLAYAKTNKNPGCPTGECPVLEAYTHLKWRTTGVSPFVLGNSTDSGWEDIYHQGCTTQLISYPPELPLTAYDGKYGTWNYVSTYTDSEYSHVWGFAADIGGNLQEDTWPHPTAPVPIYVTGSFPDWRFPTDCWPQTWEGRTGGFVPGRAEHQTYGNASAECGVPIVIYTFTGRTETFDGGFKLCLQDTAHVGTGPIVPEQYATGSKVLVENGGPQWEQTVDNIPSFPKYSKQVITITIHPLDAISGTLAELNAGTLDPQGRRYAYVDFGNSATFLYQYTGSGFTWKPIQQETIGAVSGTLSGTDLTDVQDALDDSVSMWYEDTTNPGDFYEVTDTGQTGPTTNGFQEPDNAIGIEINASIDYLTCPFMLFGEEPPHTSPTTTFAGGFYNIQNNNSVDGFPFPQPPDPHPASVTGHRPPRDLWQVDLAGDMVVDALAPGCPGYGAFTWITSTKRTEPFWTDYDILSSTFTYTPGLNSGGECPADDTEENQQVTVSVGPTYDNVLEARDQQYTEDGVHYIYDATPNTIVFAIASYRWFKTYLGDFDGFNLPSVPFGSDDLYGQNPDVMYVFDRVDLSFTESGAMEGVFHWNRYAAEDLSLTIGP